MGKLAVSEAPVPAVRVRAPVSRKGRLDGTDQQEAFWSAVTDTDANIVLEARAGTGKSTSCREAIWRLMEADPSARTAYVAFNRAIADEFKEQLPPGSSATTMHSAGLSAVRDAFPHIGGPDRKKMWRHVDAIFPRRDASTRKAKAAALRLTSLCKGFLIDSPDPDTLGRLCASFGVNLPIGLRSVTFDAVPRLLAKSLDDTAAIDFDDMVWLPVKLGLNFPETDLLFVDEAQDLNPCQHALVQLAAGSGRLAVVGDPRQAIYGFRGADSRSMATLAECLAGRPRGLTMLPLTKTRRCPTSHVDLVNPIVPDFEAMVGAKGGRIDSDSDRTALVPGVMTLCRTNAPLVSLAFKLVGANVPVAIQGKDLGEGLAKLIESFDATTAADLTFRVERYRASELNRLDQIDGSEDDIERLQDSCDCINAAAVGCITADDVSGRVRTLFVDCKKADQGSCVLLSSVHRAKGREAEHVAILSPEQLPHPMARSPQAVEQEHNIAYVAGTRSLHRLSFFGPIPPIFAAG